MTESAIVLANGLFGEVFAKTAHGLVRGPSRYRILGVVDPSCAGADAGEVLDGERRGIPIAASARELLDGAGAAASVCVLGVATEGGVLPEALRVDLLEAARRGLTLVNGLHQLLGDDPELARAARESGARIVDLRRPRPAAELRFWTGEVEGLATPRVAVLGTDCAVGKRTTCWMLADALRREGLRAEIVYTGQTGWLQGLRWGFLLDATPNDFVSGELEGAVLACARDARPDLILLEGQSALRNPSGPCGAELILSAGAAGVVLQHAPARPTFLGLEPGRRIPPLGEEVELVRLLGSEVWAVTLNEEGLEPADAERARAALAEELGLPVASPLRGGVAPVAAAIRDRLGLRGAQ